MYISPVSPVAVCSGVIFLLGPLCGLLKIIVFIWKKQQFLCEGMGLLSTCSTGEGFFSFSPFQVIACFSLKARKVTLRQEELADKKGWSLKGGSRVRHKQGCFSWHYRDCGGGEKWGAEGYWPVKLRGIMGLESQVSNNLASTTLWQGRPVWMSRSWELHWQWIDSCLDWNICVFVLFLFLPFSNEFYPIVYVLIFG